MAQKNIEANETSELCDYGIVQSGSKLKRELKRAFQRQRTKTTSSDHKAYDFNIVVLTDKTIIFIPVKYGGVIQTKLKQKRSRVETYPRSDVSFKVNRTDKHESKQPAVVVDFTLPDGSVKKLELYNSPGRWKDLAE